MKQKILGLALVLSVIVPVSVYGAVFRAGEEINTESGQVMNEDVYLAGGSVHSMANIQGDLMAAGGNVNIVGSTTQDVMATGGQVTISGNVGDDVRAAGGSITLSGDVVGDVLLGGGQITIPEGTTIGGEAVIAGGSVFINGVINGTVRVNAEKLKVGPQAVINGKLTYSSPEEATIENASSVKGGVVFNKTNVRTHRQLFDFGNFIFKFIGLLVIALLIQWLFKSRALQLSLLARNNVWRNLARGFIALIIIPILVLLALITIIGIPVGIIAICAYIILIIASCLLLPTVVGAWIMKYTGKSETLIVDWKSALAGTLFITVIGIIPVLGALVNVVLFLILFGIFIRYSMNLISRNSF